MAATGQRYCFIEGCGEPATLVLHTYPDMTRLCSAHKHLHTGCREDWDPPDEPCMRPAPCELCGDESGTS